MATASRPLALSSPQRCFDSPSPQSATDLEERCGAFEDQLHRTSRQLQPLGGEVSALQSRIERIESSAGDSTTQGDRTRKEIAGMARMLTEGGMRPASNIDCDAADVPSIT